MCLAGANPTLADITAKVMPCHFVSKKIFDTQFKSRIATGRADRTQLCNNVLDILQIAAHWNNDFCWAASFEPSFIASMMYEGYLPTAHGPVESVRGQAEEYIVLPKLHEQRCLIMFEKLKVSALFSRSLQ